MIREGVCKICERYGKLSKEHFPPERAYNEGPYVVETLDSFKSRENAVWRRRKKQGGNYSYVLCEECNNRTGQWYGGEYVKLAQTCYQYAHPFNADQFIKFSLLRFYPLRVFKQVLSIFLVSADTENFYGHSVRGLRSSLAGDMELANFEPDFYWAQQYLPTIRYLVQNKEAIGFPEQLRVYFYITCGGGGRKSGFAQMSSRSTGNTILFSEFAWKPLGWALIFDGQLREPLLDITNWANFHYDEEISVQICAPCLWIQSRHPLDFASPKVIKERRKKSSFFVLDE